MHFRIVTHYSPTEKVSLELSERDNKLAESFREACRPFGINHGDQTVVILGTNHRLAIVELDHAEPVHRCIGAWLEYESSDDKGAGNIILCVANEYAPKTYVRYRVKFGAAEAILMLFVRILSRIDDLAFPEAAEPMPSLELAR